jgi:putative chitinase
VSVANLQKKIGVVADGDFGKKTLKAARDYYGLSDKQAAHFFAQCAHETGDFRLFSENLNYSADALMRVFPKYFNKVSAVQYARLPERIANRVYANRMGNGDEASGDGWRYRGRGALQLTGKANYKDFADWLGKPIEPNDVADEYAFDSAKYFFDRSRLWAICDDAVTDSIVLMLTRRINGGTNGLSDRVAKTQKYYGWLTE